MPKQKPISTGYKAFIINYLNTVCSKGRAVFLKLIVFFVEVTVLILKSMFWRAAQNSAKMRAGAPPYFSGKE